MERNYNTYLLGMEKGNADKLFFLNHLCLDDFDYIVDFGCGRGDIIKTCSQMSKAVCYGIEKDPFMRAVACDNCKDANVILLESLNELNISKGNRVLFIFSSVLHEVGDYWYKRIEPFITKYCSNRQDNAIAIRDMYFGGSEYEEINNEDLAKVVRNANPKMLSEFIAKYGMSRKIDLYHYLLKYSYIDNWELELEEDYFSFDWNFRFEHTVLYSRQYTLPFKKERIKEDFGITLDEATHKQVIIKF